LSRSLLEQTGVQITDHETMIDVNFDDDTRIEKLSDGTYIYLVGKEDVYQQIDGNLQAVWDADLHTRYRDRLLNRPPYTKMALI